MQRYQPYQPTANAASSSTNSNGDSPPRRTPCTVCGKSLARAGDLARHMKTHDPNKEQLMHSCPYPDCSHKTLQRSNLQTHILTHTTYRPLTCPYLLSDGTRCGFSTGDPSSLHRHKKRHEPQPQSHEEQR